MKHFAYEFDQKNIPDSFEERVNVIRKIGKQGKKDFEEKYSHLAAWFRDYDALYLLSYCVYYFSTYEAGLDEEVEKGHLEFPPHFQEILQAFSLCNEQAVTARPLLDHAEPFKKEMREIGDAMLWKMFDIPENLSTEKEINAYHIRTEMMTHTLAIRGWAYDHQIKKVLADLCELLADDCIKAFGFSLAPLFKLLYVLLEKVNDRINVHRDKVHNVLSLTSYDQVFDAYEKEFPHLSISDRKTRERLWEHFGKNLNYMRFAVLSHSDLCLDKIFTFSAEEIAAYSDGQFSKDQIIFIFDKLSYRFKELKDFNKEHFVLDNPMHSRPFIKLDDENYFSSLWSHLPHISIRLLETLIEGDPGLNSKFNQVKADYLEKQTQKLFKENFPDAQIFSGTQWRDPVSEQQFENDLLVVQGPFALIVECKSGLPTPAAKRGAPERLFKTLQSLVEEPSEQALRFIEFLKRTDNTLNLYTKNGKKISLDKSRIRYFIPLGITFAQLGAIGTNLKLLIDAGVTDKCIPDLITSINLTDLQIVFDILDSPAQKIHYLQKRREFEVHNKFSGDEMDLLAFYLDTGFNLGKREFEETWFYNLNMKSKEIDPYILNKEVGIETAKPELLMTKWWKDILFSLKMRKSETWLESSYVLLNFHHEEQKEFEKMYNDLVGQIQEGKTTHKHNWVIFSSVNPHRRFMLFAYPYINTDIKERNLMIEDILTHDIPENTKGVLLIAVNLDKQHYPYSALATKLSAELFDSNFSAMRVN